MKKDHNKRKRTRKNRKRNGTDAKFYYTQPSENGKVKNQQRLRNEKSRQKKKIELGKSICIVGISTIQYVLLCSQNN